LVLRQLAPTDANATIALRNNDIVNKYLARLKTTTVTDAVK
jgi:hypothetical protein